MLSQMEGGGWEITDWSPDGSKLLVRNEISAAESYIWLIDANNGQKTLLTPKYGADTVAYGMAKFGKDGKGVYLTTDRDSEFQRLSYFDLTSKQYRFLTTSIPWDIDSFDLSNDGNLIAFVANQDGISVLHLLEVKTGHERPVPKLPAGVIGSLRFHKNNRDLAFSLNTSRSPGDAYSIDVSTGKLDRWTFSEAGGLDTSTFSEPQPPAFLSGMIKTSLPRGFPSPGQQLNSCFGRHKGASFTGQSAGRLYICLQLHLQLSSSISSM
jgi:Tol biopolymer transport system component